MTGMLVIRADADPRMGIGHVMRCLALGQAWEDAGGSVSFVTACRETAILARIGEQRWAVHRISSRHPDPRDSEETLRLLEQARSDLPGGKPLWVVCDGYHFDALYQEALRSRGYNVLVIDDCNPLPRYDCDMLLNQNPTADLFDYACPDSSIALRGLDYALLRREFRAPADRSLCADVSNLLVTLGGADPDNVTATVMRAVEASPGSIQTTRVVIGGANPHGPELQSIAARSEHRFELLTSVSDMRASLVWADLAVSACGSSLWELARMGVPSLSIVLAENQRLIAERLAGMGLIRLLGDTQAATSGAISAALNALANDREVRLSMAEQGRRMVDGLGARRVVEAMIAKSMMHAWANLKLNLRPAGFGDSDLLLAWSNDALVRANSFSHDVIQKDQHERWLTRKLGSDDCRIWILERKGLPVAVVRYDRTDDAVAVLSFSVSAVSRGRGLGRLILEATFPLACEVLGVSRVEGVAFAENRASQRCFIGSGYRLLRTTERDGIPCHVYGRQLGGIQEPCE